MNACRLRQTALVVLGLALITLLPTRVARTAPEGFDVMPPDLASVRGTVAQESLAASAIAALEDATAKRDEDLLTRARAQLVLLDAVGLRQVATRLVAGDVPAPLLPHLLYVTAASTHPAADVLLATAADARRSSVRMAAAEGLARGRTPGAVETLATLAQDPMPGVRAVALRSLFAIDSEDARRVRAAMPVDPRPHLHARRLRWHRLRADRSPDLRTLAARTYLEGRTAEERLAAARLAAQQPIGTSLDILERIVIEMGTDAIGAVFTRLALGVPRWNYDPVESRWCALMAAWVSAAHPDATPETTRRMLDRLVGWLAQPVRVDPMSRMPLPVVVLHMALPEWGDAIREPTLRRLRGDGFRDPLDGVRLLVEALTPEAAGEALRSLVGAESASTVPVAVRRAALSGLDRLGTIGDEGLARYLLRPKEDATVRRVALRILRTEPAPWAPGLLTEIVASGDPALSGTAVQILEEAHAEPEIRKILEERLFEGAANPWHRMAALIAPGDEQALQVFQRALADPRAAMRVAALQQLQPRRIPPSFKTDRVRDLVLAYAPSARDARERTHEIQQLLYALIALAPVKAVDYVREHWDEIVALDWGHIALRTMQNVHGPRVDPAVVDLVLEKTSTSDEPSLLRDGATALEGRAGHRDAEIDAFYRRLLEDERESLVYVAVTCLDHPGRGDVTDLLLPRFARCDTATPPEDQEVDWVGRLLDVFEHQPRDKVTPVLVELLLDPQAAPASRRTAAKLLVNHLTPETRQTLLTWLVDVGTDHDDTTVQAVVARAVGTGGGPVEAVSLYAVLVRVLDRCRPADGDMDPDDPVDYKAIGRIAALARGIAFTEHAPTLERVAAIVFDPRFARFARLSVRRQGHRLGPVDASAAARLNPPLDRMSHQERGGPHQYYGMPAEVWTLVESLKPLGDEALAAVLDRVLQGLATSGEIAAFPDLYLRRVALALHDARTGDRRRAAACVESLIWRVEPVGGAVDFHTEWSRVDPLAREGRFDEAAAAQARKVTVLTRRAYDDEPVWRWDRERGIQDALAAAALAASGQDDAARVLFAQALRRAPLDIMLLRTTARIRTLAGFDLEEAEREAKRAFTLEERARSWGHASLWTADALAFVWMHRGRYDEAAALLREHIGDRDPARFHMHLAEAYGGAGRLGDAADSALKALSAEPSLADEMRASPHLTDLAGTGRLEAIIEEARERALLEPEE